MSDILILGAGMAGYGAATKLKEAGLNAQIFEKNAFYGGHCASFVFDNKWIFDDGPHISFTKNDYVRSVFAENVANDFYEFVATVDNYWKGKWIKHPAQINLHGLPPEFNTQILSEMISCKFNKEPVIANYKDWLYASYGKTFAENFPMKYTRKFHTTEAVNMSTDWLGPRLYKPDLAEVIFGMLSPVNQDVHYIKGFRYPNSGGYVSFMKGIENTFPINYQHELTSIDLKERIAVFNSHKKVRFNHVFSSLPLVELVKRIENIPANIQNAANKLAWTKCVLVNLGVKRPNISHAHWRYVYDEDLYSTRLSFPGMFGPKNVPHGCSSVQIEIYFSDKYKPLTKNPDQFIPIIKDELIELGILRVNDEVLMEKAWMSPFAQVIFDHERKENVELLHNFLLENDIYFGGRFADWSYAWSDESYLRGYDEAEKIIEKV